MWWRALVVVAVYHCLIGAWIVSTGLVTDKPLSAQQQVGFALGWPIVVSATNYMQAYAVRVMDSTKEVLDELNSGRWERKP